ncbi:pigment precursor permease, P-loop containing nucleoside triphosphate hydrolase [Artemisia annua]|uniref:Pigment permease, P-loop containing nucleoside triphosphate hydrolase n=1 Tax=Artemisia annua TaxID=35608 RepID=A0A2U1M636_ARTAN|nr:pigment precursor permease, P-loop containing nucleoside triphosphate hydrolase [Artemisia annua]
MTQEQVLTWTLTVKETVYYSAEMQLPKSMPKSEKKERADKILSDMGLQDSVNTRIGGWGVKGLSGGQKRRVSICLELLTHPKLLLLDEPTSGLDSAAPFYVMDRIVKLTRQYGITVLATIHQPSSQVFGLFNNLCLLSLGKTIYFGPTFRATRFFAVNGFPCPDEQSPADHYLMTINTDFDDDIPTGSIHAEQVINVLAESYKSSEIYMQVEGEIAAISQQINKTVINGSCYFFFKKGDLVGKKGSLQASFITQCLVLAERSLKNMYRDVGYYWLRLGIYIALGIAVGTIFYDLGSGFSSLNMLKTYGLWPLLVQFMIDKLVAFQLLTVIPIIMCFLWFKMAHARISMLMFILAFLTILAIGGFPSFVEEIKVFQGERLNGHYGVGLYVISHTMSSTPYLLIISLVPGVLCYSLAGLQREWDRFIYFALILFASMLIVESLMMVMATVIPNLLMGIITGAGIQGLMILSAGFFRLPNDLSQVFWKYPTYYISFHKYAVQGMYKNEFEGLMSRPC